MLDTIINWIWIAGGALMAFGLVSAFLKPLDGTDNPKWRWEK